MNRAAFELWRQREIDRLGAEGDSLVVRAEKLSEELESYQIEAEGCYKRAADLEMLSFEDYARDLMFDRRKAERENRDDGN